MVIPAGVVVAPSVPGITVSVVSVTSVIMPRDGSHLVVFEFNRRVKRQVTAPIVLSMPIVLSIATLL